MKLLTKSSLLYLLYSGVLLLISIPVLYFAIQHRVVEEVKENLLSQKGNIIQKASQKDTTELILWMKNLEPNVTILPSKQADNERDKFYTSTFYDKTANENTPCLILESNINVQGKFYFVKIKNSLIDSKDLIESIVRIVASLLLLIIIGLVIINRLLSKKLWKPFYHTIKKLEDYRIDKTDPLQLPATSVLEFNDLNNAIVDLTNRNQKVYQLQKEFTENASHEMQTPLAVFQAKLDLLMQTKPLQEEQYELISDLAIVIQKMKKLNMSLLLLTKIENNQFAEEEPISIKQVLEKTIEQYRLLAEEKIITIQYECIEEAVLYANSSLMEIMLGNFISNAIRHNHINGTVSLKSYKTHISFLNTGSEVPLDNEKIFQRFHKQTTDSNSIGLGLQIAKKIAEHYHFSTQYSFEQQAHQFQLNFNNYTAQWIN